MNVSCVWCVGEGEAVHTDGVCGMYMCVCVGGVCLHSVCDWGGGGLHTWGVPYVCVWVCTWHGWCVSALCVMYVGCVCVRGWVGGVHMALVVCVCTVFDVCGGCGCVCVCVGGVHMAWVVCVCTVCDICGGCVCWGGVHMAWVVCVSTVCDVCVGCVCVWGGCT